MFGRCSLGSGLGGRWTSFFMPENVEKWGWGYRWGYKVGLHFSGTGVTKQGNQRAEWERGKSTAFLTIERKNTAIPPPQIPQYF